MPPATFNAISGMAAAPANPQGNVLTVIVDVNDPSMAPTGTDKNLTLANLRRILFAGGTGFNSTDPLAVGTGGLTVAGGGANITGNSVISGNVTGIGSLSVTSVIAGAWLATVIAAAYGGTGVASPTSGNLLVGAGSSAMTQLAFGSAGNYVRSNGSAWVSNAGVPAADVTGQIGATQGGTGLSAAALGDLIYASAANTWARLAGNTGSGQQFLVQTGTGSVSAAPSWHSLVSADVTDAASINTASVLVKRDGSGNFSAGTITAALTGNATTATTLQTARAINGVNFDGSAPITITAAAGTLTGTTLNASVVTSSLTSVGTIGTGVWQGTVVGATYGGTGINNGSSTITLGGSFATSGAYATTLTVTNTTNVTLPTSGTLVNSAVTSLSSLAGVGTITSGTWQGSVVAPAYGGTGVANNAANTITFSGNYGLTLTLTAGTSLTLPTSGTLVNSAVTTLSSLTTVGILASTHLTSPVVDSGGLTITAGGLTVSAGGAGVTGAVSFTTDLISTTPLATPGALSATQFTGFASTGNGASVMGYGTTYDVTLFNRAGTAVLGIGPNNTTVTIPGTLALGGATVSGAPTFSVAQTLPNSSVVGGVTFNAGAVTGATTIAASTSITVTSASASALAVGLAGATNPAFVVNNSTASQAAGLSVTGAIAAGTVAVAVISSGAAANLTLNALGTGTIGIGSVSTGVVTITPNTIVSGTFGSGTHTVTSASATSIAVGPNGTTTPIFAVDSSTGSAVAGFKITGAATGGTVALVVTDSGSNTNLTINAKGSGTIGIGSVSTGAVTITPATTLSAALTYGGVTLSNAVTGTGNMVLSASPTFTGTAVVASETLNGTLTLTGATVAGSPTWSNTQNFAAITSTGTYTQNSAGDARILLNGLASSSAAYVTLEDAGVGTWNVGHQIVSANGHFAIYDLVNSAMAIDITPGANPAVAFNGAVSGVTTLVTSGEVTGGTNVVVGSSTDGYLAMRVRSGSAPGNPADGWRIYADASGNLYAKNASGTVRTLAAP